MPYAHVRMVRPLNDLVADDCGTAKQDADCQMSRKQTHAVLPGCSRPLLTMINLSSIFFRAIF